MFNLPTRRRRFTPVEDAALRDDLLDALDRCRVDDVLGWELDRQCAWTRRTPGAGMPRSAQSELMARHAARAAEVLTDA